MGQPPISRGPAHLLYGHLPRDGAQGVSGSTHDCESDIRVLANAFRRFGWGAPLV